MKRNLVAENAGELSPLPDRLPITVEARVGEIEFRRGLPTRSGLDKIHEIQDFQRACQLYQWAIPAVGVMGWHKASQVNGATRSTDWVVFDDAAARSGLLTPETQVAYVLAFPDLHEAGPLLLEYCAGRISGCVMDYWQRPVADFGYTGPEKGATAGRLLIVGPGQRVPDGAECRAAFSSTRVAMVMYRVLSRPEIDRYIPHNRLYPFAERAAPPRPHVVWARKAFTQSQPRGLAYWEWLHELIQREPAQERDRLFLGMLRSLGIEKGSAFEPDERSRRILIDATTLGEQMTRALTSDRRKPSPLYQTESRWQLAAQLEPDQRQPCYDEFDERTDFFYRCVGSPHLAALALPGIRCLCLCTFKDLDGDWLDGALSYRLRLPPVQAPREFWSIALYDLDARTLLMPDSARAEIHRNSENLRSNPDGSVDMFFGPVAPEGAENNWLETRPGRSWYPLLRLFAPAGMPRDVPWPIADLEKVRSPLMSWWSTLARPARRLRAAVPASRPREKLP
ncbi:MAG: DUF1214 domain-containing protein [Longimicrobiales bacterium]